MRSGAVRPVPAFIKKLFDVLSSKAFLVWMTGGWVLYYVMSAIWTREAFSSFVSGLEKNDLVRILYIIFLVSGYLNLIRASIRVFKKGKIQFVLWLFLPLGAVVFFTGFFMSVSFRQMEQVLVGEGDIIQVPWDQDRFLVTKINPGLRENITDLDAWKGIFAYEPKVAIVDSRSQPFLVGAYPPKEISGTYYHILNFGLAPGVRLLEKGQIRSEGYMALKILQPGSSDLFDIEGYPYRFQVSMEPVKTILRGNVVVSQFDLRQPFYKVKVYRNEEVIAEGISKEAVRFDDLTLEFYKPVFWAMMEIARDPGTLPLRIGIILVFIGIPISLVMAIMARTRRA